MEEKKARNNKTCSWDEWAKEINELAEEAPSGDEILAQFEKGDFSSVDPEFFNQTEEELQQSIDERYEKYKKAKKKKPITVPDKDPEASL